MGRWVGRAKCHLCKRRTKCYQVFRWKCCKSGRCRKKYLAFCKGASRRARENYIKKRGKVKRASRPPRKSLTKKNGVVNNSNRKPSAVRYNHELAGGKRHAKGGKRRARDPQRQTKDPKKRSKPVMDNYEFSDSEGEESLESEIEESSNAREKEEEEDKMDGEFSDYEGEESSESESEDESDPEHARGHKNDNMSVDIDTNKIGADGLRKKLTSNGRAKMANAGLGSASRVRKKIAAGAADGRKAEKSTSDSASTTTGTAGAGGVDTKTADIDSLIAEIVP